MKQTLILLMGLTIIWACSDTEQGSETPSSAEVEAEVPAASAPEQSVEKENNSTSVSQAELALLEPFLLDLRKGIREFSPNSIGLCKGQGKECSEFIGLDGGTLDEGKYMIRGDFQAPKLSPEEGWKVAFVVDCEIAKVTGDSTSTTSKSYSKEYKVTHVNRTEYGYRLSPLYTITSPSSRGTESCVWSITAKNLDAEKVWKGSYTIPAK
jgi:hypothetical protein